MTKDPQAQDPEPSPVLINIPCRVVLPLLCTPCGPSKTVSPTGPGAVSTASNHLGTAAAHNTHAEPLCSRQAAFLGGGGIMF